MEKDKFRIEWLGENPNPATLDQLLGLMTNMYDYHASLHPDWQSREGWQNESKKWFAKVASTGDWYVALAYPAGQDQACGYILTTFHYEAPLFIRHRFGYIVDLWVNQDCRGLGVAHALMKAAYGWFEKQKIDRIQLEVDIRNENAMAFWEKLGFEQFQCIMRRDFNPAVEAVR